MTTEAIKIYYGPKSPGGGETEYIGTAVMEVKSITPNCVVDSSHCAVYRVLLSDNKPVDYVAIGVSLYAVTQDTDWNVKRNGHGRCVHILRDEKVRFEKFNHPNKEYSVVYLL